MNIELVFIISYIIISTFGVLLHFTHPWYKKGIILHFISAINESTWEHMKLAFYPMLISLISHYVIFGFKNFNFWSSALLVLLCAIFSIPILYYLVRSILKKEVLFISISIYFIAILLAVLLEYFLLNKEIFLFSECFGIIGIIILFLCFVVFTYFPPRIFLFKDPIFKKFGEFKQNFDKKKRRRMKDS